MIVTAKKIKQHANSLEDLIERSKKAMDSIEINNLLKKLQLYKVEIAKPNLKASNRLKEKIKIDYNFNIFSETVRQIFKRNDLKSAIKVKKPLL